MCRPRGHTPGILPFAMYNVQILMLAFHVPLSYRMQPLALFSSTLYIFTYSVLSKISYRNLHKATAVAPVQNERQIARNLLIRLQVGIKL